MLLRILLAFGLILPALSVASTCPTDNLVSDAQAFQWTNPFKVLTD